MGQKDLREKLLLSHNDVFADVVNLLFDRDVVRADELKDSRTESVYKVTNGDYTNQSRDISKYWEKGKTILAALAIENQTKIDERMPIRIIGYDGATYCNQYENTNLYPVITVVLNFSDKKWQDKYKSLSGIIDVPKEIEPYFADYKIHVIDVAFLEDNVRKQLKSDFKVISDFFYNKRIGREKDIFKDKTVLKYPVEVVEFFEIFTKDNRFNKIKKNVSELYKKGDDVTMCSVCDILEERGEVRGIEKVCFELLQKGKLSIEDVAEELGVSVEDAETRMELWKQK